MKATLGFFFFFKTFHLSEPLILGNEFKGLNCLCKIFGKKHMKKEICNFILQEKCFLYK